MKPARIAGSEPSARGHFLDLREGARAHGDPRANRVAISSRLPEDHVEPVVAVAELVPVEGVVPPVAVEEAAQLRIDVQISVSIPVDEADAVPLPEIAETRVARH